MIRVIPGLSLSGAALCLALGAGGARAQSPAISASIGGELAWSNNINQAAPSLAESELSLSLSPSLGFNYRSGRLQLGGTAGLTAYHYFGNAQPDKVYPNIGLTGSLEAIERFLFIDAAVTGQPQFLNPFGPQSTGQVSSNLYSAYTYQVAPTIKGKTLGDVDYLVRSDSRWSTTAAESGLGNTYQWDVNARLSRAPKPLGWSFELERKALNQENIPDYLNELGRVVASYLVAEDLSLSLRGGYEQTDYGLIHDSGAVYGGGFSWRPTPRTDVTGYWEQRFFGNSWQASASHRMPFLSFNLATSRDVSTTPQTLFTLPAGANVFDALDALMTTRIPDPATRAAAARRIILQEGLPIALASPVPIYGQNVALQTRYEAGTTLYGQRNSISLNVFYLRTEAISGSGVNLPPALTLINNSVQRGVGLTASHRLTPFTSVSAGASVQRTQGIGQYSAEESKQFNANLRLTQQLAPRLTGSFGLRYQRYESNVQTDFNETAALIGLSYAF